jgi:hypothetical protein
VIINFQYIDKKNITLFFLFICLFVSANDGSSERKSSEKLNEGNSLPQREEDKKMADMVQKFETHGEKLMYG